MTYWWDMDGTIANFYSVAGWLGMLLEEDTTPYEIAKPLVNMALLARYIHKVQRNGDKVGIISWTSKGGREEYNARVAEAKIKWLNKHLPSVEWDFINIVPYGTNKFLTCGGGVLFDDEERNRIQWGNNAYTPDKIFEVLTNRIV